MKDIERMVVSAYLDGEVDSPWKEQVLAKLESDSEWAAEAEVHTRIKGVLAADPEPDFSAARTRVWERLRSGPGSTKPKVLPGAFVWGAVAAAVLVAATGTGYWLGRQSSAPGPLAADVAEVKVQVPKHLELKLSGEGQLIMASTFQGSGR